MVVFYITAASYVLAFIVYNRLGTSELQPWGMGVDEPTETPVKSQKSKEDEPKTIDEGTASKEKDEKSKPKKDK